jgi:ABC-type phosphate transport system permease subunit
MILPFNIRVVEEAMRSVPDAFREASFALGATKWETAKNIVFYAAAPGIITGILLGAGAAMGESALVLVAQSLTYPEGTQFNPTFPVLTNLFGKQANGFPSLAVFIYNAATLSPIEVGTAKSPLSLLGKGYLINQNAWSVAFAGAAVLIAMYLVICVAAMFARNRLAKKITGK